MKPPADGWDPEEREALASIEDELGAIRARHGDDPPLELLRAADGGALPPGLQERVSGHLAESAWSRTLVEGANAVDALLDDVDADRLLARVSRTAADARRQRSTMRRWAPWLATAATIAIAVIAWPSRHKNPSVPSTTSAGTSRTPVPAPAVELPLRQPEVKLSVAALTWRGPSGVTSLVDDLAPALEAFRASDYVRAARALEPLEGRYPTAIEPPFYRGISLLFQNDPGGALVELHRAERVADATFAADVAWYLAVAEQRAGRTGEARARLDTLCGTANTHAADACNAVKKLDAPR